MRPVEVRRAYAGMYCICARANENVPLALAYYLYICLRYIRVANYGGGRPAKRAD